MAQNKIWVEVAYALAETQKIIPLYVEKTASIQAIILQSGILQFFPEINIHEIKVGVFGKRKLLTDHVDEHDRIEIYRNLCIDPKIARRNKVLKK